MLCWFKFLAPLELALENVSCPSDPGPFGLDEQEFINTIRFLLLVARDIDKQHTLHIRDNVSTVNNAVLLVCFVGYGLDSQILLDMKLCDISVLVWPILL